MRSGQDGAGFRKRGAEWVARTRVAAGIALALAACGFAEPTPASLAIGIAIALPGLGLRSWAAGYLRKNERLTVSGPFAHVRNPLYLGSLVAGLGLGVATAVPFLTLAVLAVFVVWYLPVVAEEESHLRAILPGYREYEARVPRLVPALKPAYAAKTRYDWKLFARNREYSAAIGFAGFVGVLCVKMHLT